MTLVSSLSEQPLALKSPPPKQSRWRSYKEASEWAKAHKIGSQSQWHGFKNRPANIPSAPDKVYPKEFNAGGGWGGFLGKGTISNQNKRKGFATYAEASAWAKKQGIVNRKQWAAFKNRPAHIPSHPDQVYPKEFKVAGWGRFLGTGIISVQDKRKGFVSYTEASAWAQAQGIADRKRWRAIKNRPDHIPSDPHKAYPEEFKDGGWGRFLGTGTISTRNKNKGFATYVEASAWAQKRGIVNHQLWRAVKNRPAHIPAEPWRVYRQEFKNGGMDAFLGLKKMSGVSQIERCLRHVLEDVVQEFHPRLRSIPIEGGSGQTWQVDVVLPSLTLIVEYDGSRFHGEKRRKTDERKTADLLVVGWKVVRVRGQNKQQKQGLLRAEWDVAVQEQESNARQIETVLNHLGALDQNGQIALTEAMRARMNEWREGKLAQYSFRDVLLAYDGWCSYEEASAWAQAHKIGSVTQWRAIKDRPAHIPSHPDQVYPKEFEAEGGWGGFLNTGVISAQNKSKGFVSYAEASVWAQEQGIADSKQWRAVKNRPKDIPSNPSRVYPKEFNAGGGWGGFLGTGEISSQNKSAGFATYAEASAWAQAQGISDRKRWRTIKNRPDHIPARPDQVYPEKFNEGGGWGGFLGSGSVSVKNKSKGFATYVEASAWAQAHKIGSVTQWRAIKDRPAHIPSNPDQVYPKEFEAGGGWGGFLKTGAISPQNKRKGFATYAEASAWAQQQGIQTFKEWRVRCQQGLPPHIPADLLKVYRDEWMKQGGAAAFFGPLKLPVAPIPVVEASPSPLHEPPRSRCRP